jgi:hypothetical protein
VATETRSVGVETTRRGAVDSSWSLVGERTTTDVNLQAADRPPRADGWTTREGASFRAVRIETTTRTWRRNGEVTTTRSVVARTLRVDVALQARTVPVLGAPPGILDGPLADATDRAVDDAVSDAGAWRPPRAPPLRAIHRPGWRT